MVHKISIEDSFKRIDYLFRWTGMNVGSASKTPAQNRKYKYLFWFNCMWVNSDTIGAIVWFTNGMRQGESLTSLTYQAPCIALTMLANLRSLSFVFYEDNVNELLAILKELEMKQNLRSNFGSEAEMVTKEAGMLHSILRALNFFNWSLIVSFPMMALIAIWLNYKETGNVQLLLPLLIEYPFDQFDMKIWPFVLMRQIYSILVVVLIVCGSDFFFYICCTYTRIHFKILRMDFENLIPSQGISRSKMTEDEQFRARFKELVLRHQQLIRCVSLIEVTYSKSTLFNFVSSSALICLTGFNVTTIDDITAIISFLNFLFTSLLQIFFLCFFGDMLTVASVDVADGIYNSRWYSAEPKIGKNMLIVLNRARKPCKLTAYGYADVDLAAFTKVLSTSWSYFALLRTMYSTDE